MKEENKKRLLSLTPFSEEDIDYFLNYLYDHIKDDDAIGTLLNFVPGVAHLNQLTLKDVITLYANNELQPM